MTLVAIKPAPAAAAEDVVAMLEDYLKLAKAGRIQHCLVVGVEARNNHTHRGFCRELNVSLIGAVHVALDEMMRDYARHSETTPEPPVA